MVSEQMKRLLWQTLEHERGSVDIYQTALKCAQRDDLKDEWTRCLAHIRHHELILTEACRKLSIHPELMTAGREATKYLGESLISAMEMVHESGEPHEAELMACECVALSETTSHSNWQLIEKCAHTSTGEQKQVLLAAVGEVKDEVDEHYYHARGWERELWLHSLGIEAVLPPPEEREHVISPIRAGQVEHGRESLDNRPS
jgi:hypothetical protein